ncbi:MAG: HAD family hydrolase [Thermoguttaceae bacterium]
MQHRKKQAVFLDRDGVIIENRPDHIKTWEEVRFLDGSFEALVALASLPVTIVVVSNQGVVGRGLLSLETAWELQRQIVEVVTSHGGRIDASYLCPHHPSDGCTCRKPAPGMLLQAARELNLDLKRSWLVGDAATDLEAAHAAGSRGILVRTGRGKDQELGPLATRGGDFPIVDDLAAAVRLIAAAQNSYTTRSHS